MPRARLSDARCITYADLPILPFLAPRIFTESPFRQTELLRNVQNHTPTEQDKRRGQRIEREGDVEFDRTDGLPAYGQGQIPSRHRRFPEVLSNASTHKPWRSHASSTHLPRTFGQISVGRPYFPVNQRRSYATTPQLQSTDMYSRPEAKDQSRKLDSLSYSTSASAQGIGSIVEEAEAYTQLPDDALSSSVYKEGSNLDVEAGNDEATALDKFRLQCLTREKKRLENFLSYNPVNHRAKIVQRGRYRSLARRIYNLERDSEEKIDLAQGQRPTHTDFTIHAFAALDRRVYPWLRDASYALALSHDPRCEQWIEEVFNDVQADIPEGQLKANWMKRDDSQREANWHLMLLYLLDKHPDRALQFILVLTQESSVKSLSLSIVTDALEHLARLYVQKGATRTASAHRPFFVPALSYIIREHLITSSRMCSQDLLWNAALLATEGDLKVLFDVLMAKKIRIEFDTFLHYASMFGKHGEPQYALRCLREMLKRTKHADSTKALVKRKRYMWTCALILRKSVSGGRNYHMTNQIVADILDLGVKLDILLYNVIMRNAMEAADPATAFRVYESLKANGLEPDKYTYSILLDGCIASPDPAEYRTFAEHCASRAKYLDDPWLATHYLYYLYVLHKNDSPDAKHARLTRAYAQFFDSTSLELFGLHSETPAEPLIEQHLLFQPLPATLYLIIQLEIQKAATLGPTQVWKLYHYFKRVVQDGAHPILNQLAKKPTVWNAFLLAFCKHQQFESASELVKSMTDGEVPGIPQPNVYSWNIFMQAFFKKGQVRAADRIYEMMQSRGVEPDQFTFGVLLMGYAKAQQVERIGEIMQEVSEEQGMDDALVRSLMAVVDRRRLMMELENAKGVKQHNADERAAAAEEERRRRWDAPTFGSLLSPKRG